jgi:glycosyltransferase involved in cell wall biosynthesis
MEEIELSIMIPCLNEETALPFSLQRANGFIASHNILGEVIVADNGSIDKSKEIALDHKAILVNAREKGYGAAIMAGLQKTRRHQPVLPRRQALRG